MADMMSALVEPYPMMPHSPMPTLPNILRSVVIGVDKRVDCHVDPSKMVLASGDKDAPPMAVD